MEKLLNIPDVAVEKTEINKTGDVIITVRSTREGSCCDRCGAEIDKPYGQGKSCSVIFLFSAERLTSVSVRRDISVRIAKAAR
ncbi:Uncharacterized protein dnm_034660 [Desulfonema magnum]|uniref:Transposase IS204/IS1001/IS1096/IS1165 zinc-finger domain-containing protein n=2 Tax=Desulfonema magnum TaxID=45655 RepID=A0A975GN62_9BACT|nr:Uncharacterized protein dnm_034660 [Desulfonema magnum]